MILRVVDRDFPIDIDGEAPRVGEIGVANLVLSSEAGRNAQIGRPPVRLGGTGRDLALNMTFCGISAAGYDEDPPARLA